MFRRFIHLAAVLGLLVQGLSLAWAQPQLSARSAAPAMEAQAELPPCHQGAPASKTQKGKLLKTSACCGEACTCPDLCAAATPALPGAAAELNDFINAHHDAVRDAGLQAPAHAFTPLRPPAAPHS